mgnify:CR=1 FL=1
MKQSIDNLVAYSGFVVSAFRPLVFFLPFIDLETELEITGMRSKKVPSAANNIVLTGRPSTRRRLYGHGENAGLLVVVG